MDLPTFLAVGLGSGVIAITFWDWIGVFVALLFIFAVGVLGYRSKLRADGDGLTVRNQYRSYKVPWADVRGIVADKFLKPTGRNVRHPRSQALGR